MPATMPSVHAEPWRRRLYLPAYTITDAARYAHTHAQTIAYWFYREGAHTGPVLSGKERRQPLSYLQLVEVAFIATFRQLGVPLQRIRMAREYLAQTFKSEYPFAEMRLMTEGQHVLLPLHELEPDAVNRLIVADSHGQMAWQPLVADRFAEFDYEYGLALVWHVAGRTSPVTIDPRISFGAPTVRGIPTWAIKGRWMAGETLEDIQRDFELTTEDVQRALEFEGISVA